MKWLVKIGDYRARFHLFVRFHFLKLRASVVGPGKVIRLLKSFSRWCTLQCAKGAQRARAPSMLRTDGTRSRGQSEALAHGLLNVFVLELRP